jgi:alcohol dehydrogenase class IV
MANTLSVFSFPTRIVFGPGVVRELGSEARRLNMTRPLLVADRGVVACGLAQKVTTEFERAGVAPSLFDDVNPNPVEKNVHDGLEAYRRGNCDGVVGLGGGSPIDSAKAIRLVVTHPFPLEQYDDKFDGGAKIHAGVPPMIAIPTTAGTGSEVGRSTVIILKATDRKTVIFSPYLLANVAVADPELTVGMPPKITAGTGLDALTHNVEAYLSLGYHPMCDAIALQGARLAFQNLPRAVHHGDDLEARTNMLMAAMMGAVAFQKGLGTVHSLAHPLSSIANLHHGTTNGILLPHVMEFNRSVSESRQRDLAVAMEIASSEAPVAEAASALIARLRQLLPEVGISTTLGALGVTREQIPLMSIKAMEDACHQCNPRPCVEADMIALYEKAL